MTRLYFVLPACNPSAGSAYLNDSKPLTDGVPKILCHLSLCAQVVESIDEIPQRGANETVARSSCLRRTFRYDQ